MAEKPKTFRHESSTQLSGQLPLDVLPPETIARLRVGGELTEAELELVRSSALANSGLAGRLIGAALESGMFTERRSGAPLPNASELVDGQFDAIGVQGSARTFEWKWEPGGPGAGTAEQEPVTYYELLSGQQDPHREFFLTARRLLGIATWVLALAIPLGLVVLALATGQSIETAFFLGVFGAIVGAMIRKSAARPFG